MSFSLLFAVFLSQIADAERGSHLAPTHGGVITHEEEGQQAQ
jgi:hypothetical protein